MAFINPMMNSVIGYDHYGHPIYGQAPGFVAGAPMYTPMYHPAPPLHHHHTRTTTIIPVPVSFGRNRARRCRGSRC
ncbi:hypothetical protein CYY_003625 [Polysphondylium violaceum]|uniref:Uncharacterized protein n=1 Tax=Polysphondylium violaceum TaxID=133409 RepID=A0A8J4V0Z0_9MYCE|nr:hypothetical protein CYY_003625 [Polysphondylium violaceum]